MKSLEKLLCPSSIIVVGASDDFVKIGGRVMKYLLKFGYNGEIYPVNPKYQNIQDIRCYPSIADVPEQVDTALIAIRASLVPQTVRECAEHGVKTAIVFSAGFAEIGGKGVENQETLRTLISETGIRVCGPNCIGIINFNDKIAMSFTGFLEIDKLIPGGVGFISQSGALGGTLLSRAQDRKIGFSYFISTGNEVDLDIVDFMDFMVDAPDTFVIAAYVEQIRNTGKFLRVAERALEVGKPIIVLKVGETESGKRAASSHTGALTGSDIAYSAAFKQKGVIRVEEYDDLIETMMLFSKSNLPRGGRVGVISGTGGGAIIMTDKITKRGSLSLPPLFESTKEKLSKATMSFASIGNPVDLTGQLYEAPQMYRQALDLLAQDDNIDIVMPIVSMVAKERAVDRASAIIHTSTLTSKPVVTWWTAGSLSKPGFKLLDESRVALFKSPDRCIRALSSLVAYSQFRKEFLGTKKEEERKRTMADEATISLCRKGQLSEHEAKVILSSYGIPVTREEVATSEEEAVEIASQLGYPVALKISSHQISHKSDAGGVKVNLNNELEVRECYREIIDNCRKYDSSAVIEGVLVQEMVTDEGTEVIVGVSTDPAFGLMVVFGLGGIFVEVMRDISVRILPVTPRDAWAMVREIKGYEILEGTRGKKPRDIDGIVDLILKISNLATDLSQFISEIDLNPVIVFGHGKGVKVIDALIKEETSELSIKRRTENVKATGP